MDAWTEDCSNAFSPEIRPDSQGSLLKNGACASALQQEKKDKMGLFDLRSNNNNILRKWGSLQPNQEQNL